MKKVVFALNSYGLGHATRTLPVIKSCIDNGFDVYVIAYGRSLKFLQFEISSGVKEFIELRDYSFFKVFDEKKFSTLKFTLNYSLFMKEVKAEHAAFLALHAQHTFDLVFSDSRPGIYAPGLPCYYLSNQLSVGAPNIFNSITRLMSEHYNYRAFKNFTRIVVPDSQEQSISGDITHKLFWLRKRHIDYVGILSMIKKLDVPKDIDYFFSISGPEPQRTVMEKNILSQIDTLQGKNIVITLGVPEKKGFYEKRGTIEIHGVLDRTKQTEMLNRAKLVITRSGYSTVMDLAEIDQKALFIPTEGQPEQEYLATYHDALKNNLKVRLHDLTLPDDLIKANEYAGYKPTHKTVESVRRILALMTQDLNE